MFKYGEPRAVSPFHPFTSCGFLALRAWQELLRSPSSLDSETQRLQDAQKVRADGLAKLKEGTKELAEVVDDGEDWVRLVMGRGNRLPFCLSHAKWSAPDLTTFNEDI